MRSIGVRNSGHTYGVGRLNGDYGQCTPVILATPPLLGDCQRLGRQQQQQQQQQQCIGVPASVRG